MIDFTHVLYNVVKLNSNNPMKSQKQTTIVGQPATIITIVMLTLFSIVCHAQAIKKVTGKVTDLSHEPMIGNVLILNSTDSTLINGASFLEGNFEVSGLNAYRILLKLTSLQFADTFLIVGYMGQEHVELGTIKVKNGYATLGEVVVYGGTPLFTNRPDGVVQINVANTILSSTNSVTEILTRSPNVIVGDNGISVFGKGQAIIYLNGKRITNERLPSISALTIKTIEIISNPSSKYDAEGRAVINIVTTGDGDNGYRGAATQMVTVSKLAGVYTNTNVNMNFKKGKIELAGNYDLKLGNDKDLFNTTRLRPSDSDYLDSRVESSRVRDYQNVSNYNFGLSHAIKDKSYISLEYNGFYENIDDLSKSKNNIVTNTENGLYQTVVSRDGKTGNNSVTLNYNNAFDDLGSSLFVGVQFSKYTGDIKDHIQEENVVNDEIFSRPLRSYFNNDITIASPQVDLTKVFRSNNKLEIGTKLSYVKTLFDLDFYLPDENGGFVTDTERSNNFEYTEIIPAAYVNFSGAINKKFSYGFGARSETTIYELMTTVGNQETVKKNYTNVFPNAQINGTLSRNWAVRAAYTSRITRPPYQALNPFLIYLDKYTSAEGNPNLIPAKMYTIELGATYKIFDLEVGYNYTIDPLDAAALRGDDDKSYVLKSINLDKGYTYYARLSTNITTKIWSSVNVISVSYNELTDNTYSFTMIDAKPQMYLYSNNKFNVNNLFTIQALGWYLGDKYYRLYHDESRMMVTLGLEKDFFKKSLRCSFTANDVFHRNYPSGDYEVGQTFVTYYRLFNTNYYRLSLTYNFGGLKKSTYKSKATGESENRRARN